MIEKERQVLLRLIHWRRRKLRRLEVNAVSKEDVYTPIRRYAQSVREQLSFTSESIDRAPDRYVAWLDLMGAGHTMEVSVHKAANALVRLHMAVEIARRKSGYTFQFLPINDGIFIIGESKGEIMHLLRHSLILLSAHFISTPRPHDRYLLKGAIAYGPVYTGMRLSCGIRDRKMRNSPDFLSRMAFGPPIIQAYKSESQAPPFGISIHSSARSFAPPDAMPFKMTHWLWWQNNEESKPVPNTPSLQQLKELLAQELDTHYKWMTDTAIFNGLDAQKIEQWKKLSKQYFYRGDT